MMARARRTVAAIWHATEAVYETIRFDVLDTPLGWGLLGGACTLVGLKLALGV